jgi:uncharacterized SAM-dependent methyltransferase
VGLNQIKLWLKLKKEQSVRSQILKVKFMQTQDFAKDANILTEFAQQIKIIFHA